jgi:hypothetical protein
MQHALQFWTVVSYLPGTEQSSAGGHERAPEVEQVPAAEVKGRRKREKERDARMSCIVCGALNGNYEIRIQGNARQTFS